jgi:hypothetical protein
MRKYRTASQRKAARNRSARWEVAKEITFYASFPLMGYVIVHFGAMVL